MTTARCVSAKATPIWHHCVLLPLEGLHHVVPLTLSPSVTGYLTPCSNELLSTNSVAAAALHGDVDLRQLFVTEDMT